MDRGNLEVRRVREGAGDRLVLEGDLDFAHSNVLRDVICLALAENDRIVLDLSGVEHFDSTGLSQLVWAHSEASLKNWSLSIENPPERVRDYLQRTGLDRILPLE